MRIDTVIKFHFPFEYWTLRVNTDGTTGYVKKAESKGMLIPGGSGGSSLVSREPMNVYMQVRNVRDRSGREIFTANGEAYPMYVTSSEPQLDTFSNVIGYRHQLRRELPREYSQFIAEVLEQG